MRAGTQDLPCVHDIPITTCIPETGRKRHDHTAVQLAFDLGSLDQSPNPDQRLRPTSGNSDRMEPSAASHGGEHPHADRILHPSVWFQAVWNTLLGDLARRANLSAIDAARGYALLSMTMHDGLLVSFDGKFRSTRPGSRSFPIRPIRRIQAI